MRKAPGPKIEGSRILHIVISKKAIDSKNEGFRDLKY